MALNIKKIYNLLLFFLLLSLPLMAKEKVSLQLQWKYQFQFAGYIAAKEKGFYKDIGLDVDIKEWQPGIDMIDEVTKGNATFAIARPTAFLNKETRKNIRLLAAIFQSSPLVLLADKSSGIKTIRDFKNKRLMSSGDLNTDASIVSMLFSQGVDIDDLKIIPPSFNVNDLMNGKTDLMASYISNEPYVLEQNNGTPVVFDPKEYGFAFYNDIVVTHTKNSIQKSVMVQNFIDATLKGWSYAFENIDEIAKVIYNKYNTQNKTLDAYIYEGKELKKLAINGKDPLGSITQEKMQRIYDVYRLMGLTSEKNLNFSQLIFPYGNTGKGSITKEEINSLLNKQEQEYVLKNSQVKVCTNPNWTPIEFSDKETPKGISIDTLKLISEKTNLKFEFVKTSSWKESQKFLKEKKCDILPAAIATKKRKEYANFTNSYLNYDLAIITAKDKPLVNEIEAIIDKSMARKTASGLIAVLKERYPTINIIETKGYKEAFEAVNDGDIYFTIATLPILSYYKNSYGLDNLQIAGYTQMKYNLSIAVRDDNKTLLNILNKALHDVSTEEKNIIHEKWLNKKFQEAIDYQLIINFAIFFLVIIILFVYKQYLLNKSVKENKELLDATMEGIAILQNSIIVDINESTLEVLKYEHKKDLIGKEFISFVAEDDRKMVKENSIKSDTKSYEVFMVCKDGVKIPVLLRGRDIKGGKQRLVSMIDISSLKQKEEQLLQQAKLVSMGEMIGNIAHQWRQPLSVISTSATGIKIQKEYGILEDKFLFDACDAIDNNTQYLSKTIDDFRDFVKGDRVKLRFSAKELIESFENLISASAKIHDIEIIKDIDEDLSISGYQNELNQCFMNIFNNSKDVLDVNVQKGSERLFFIIVYQKDEKIFIEFNDNGGGIPKDVLPKIFDPYFTTKHESQGTGLGLNMTYSLITKGMDGNITAKNKEFTYKGCDYLGAHFIIELPVVKQGEQDV